MRTAHTKVMGKSKHTFCVQQLFQNTEEETSVHILFECEALASLRYTYLVSFILDPDDIKKLGVGAIWRFGNVTGLL